MTLASPRRKRKTQKESLNWLHRSERFPECPAEKGDAQRKQEQQLKIKERGRAVQQITEVCSSRRSALMGLRFPGGSSRPRGEQRHPQAWQQWAALPSSGPGTDGETEKGPSLGKWEQQGRVGDAEPRLPKGREHPPFGRGGLRLNPPPARDGKGTRQHVPGWIPTPRHSQTRGLDLSLCGQTSQRCRFGLAHAPALRSPAAEQRCPARRGPRRTLRCSAVELASTGQRAGEAARKVGWRSLLGKCRLPSRVTQRPPVPPATPLRVSSPLWPPGSAKRAR